MKKLLILVLGLSFLLRFYLLGTIPTGISNDEMYVVLNARAVFYNFSDVSATWNPLSLSPIPFDHPMSEFLPVALAIFIGPWQSNLFSAKAIYALVGTITVFLVFLFAKKLFSNKIAIVSAFILAVNPLAIFNSRVAYDIPISLSFVLLISLLIISEKRWALALSGVVTFLTFWSYVGGKLIVLPIVVASILFVKKKSVWMLIPLIVAAACFAFFVARNLNFSDSRKSELLTPNNQEVVQSVDSVRTKSMSLPVVKNVFMNKYSNTANQYMVRSATAFGADRLFISGDKTYVFFVGHQGFFFIFEIVFLFSGVVAIFKYRNRRSVIFLGVLILIGIMPSLLGSGESYSMRSYFSYMLLSIVIAFGVWAWSGNQKIKHLGLIFPGVVGLLYALFLCGFLVNLLVENPILNSSQFNFSDRILARVIKNETKYKKVVVFSSEPYSLFKNYIFFNDFLNKKNRLAIAHAVSSGSFDFNNASFKNDKNCAKFDDGESVVIVRSDFVCKAPALNKNYIVIPDINTSGANYKIYGDSVCSHLSLGNFVPAYKLGISDLQIENLSTKDFCQKFMLRQ